MKRGVSALISSFLAFRLLDSEPHAQPRGVAPGQPIAATIAGADTHEYQVAVVSGRTLHVVVEQQGVDVIVSLIDPGGALVVEMDSPNGANGPEEVWLIPVVSGSYGIRVKPFDSNGGGRYTVRVDPGRSPTAEDRRRANSQTASATGGTRHDALPTP